MSTCIFRVSLPSLLTLCFLYLVMFLYLLPTQLNLANKDTIDEGLVHLVCTLTFWYVVARLASAANFTQSTTTSPTANQGVDVVNPLQPNSGAFNQGVNLAMPTVDGFLHFATISFHLQFFSFMLFTVTSSQTLSNSSLRGMLDGL